MSKPTFQIGHVNQMEGGTFECALFARRGVGIIAYVHANRGSDCEIRAEILCEFLNSLSPDQKEVFE